MTTAKHLLYIFADQLAYHWLGCMGNDEIRTPCLDALASEGQLFKNCYSTSPVCTPYRGVLMSGLYPTQSGCRGNSDGLPSGHRFFADHLKNENVHTTYVGKWHLFNTGASPIPSEHRAGWRDFIGYQAFNDFIHDVRFFDEDGQAHRYKYHRTRATTDIAIDRLEKACGESGRIAQMVSYQAPHYPVEPDPEYYAMYANATFSDRPNFSFEGLDGEPGLDNGRWPYVPTHSPKSPQPWTADPNFQRYGKNFLEYRRHYAALVTQFDYEVGRLLNAWRRMGLWEEAAVVVTADHGEMQGAHGCPRDKGIHWEESIRVPLITKLPGAPQGAVHDEAIGTLDLRATCLDALRAGNWKGYSEGTSFLPLVKGEDFDAPPVIAEFGNWIMIRDKDWKLSVKRDSLEPTHLFNLASDPYEMTNKVNQETAIQTALQDKIKTWWQHVNETTRI